MKITKETSTWLRLEIKLPENLTEKEQRAENLRYNEQVKDLINQFFPNYKFGTNPSTDKILVEFVNNYKPNK